MTLIETHRAVHLGKSRLFIIILEEMFKQEKDINVNGKFLNYRKYARDVVLIPKRAAELQIIIKDLRRRF